MPRTARGLPVPLLAVAVIIAGCSSAPAPAERQDSSHDPATLRRPTNGRLQSHTGGAVSIDVLWKEGENGVLVFDVRMNTHSVDLDGYDLGQLALLRDDKGREYHPASWSSAPGGHHRKGTLTFPLPESLVKGTARYVELVIRDVAGVQERVLRWELG